MYETFGCPVRQAIVGGQAFAAGPEQHSHSRILNGGQAPERLSVCAPISCGMLPTVYRDLAEFGLPFVTPDDSVFPGLLLAFKAICSHWAAAGQQSKYHGRAIES